MRHPDSLRTLGRADYSVRWPEFREYKSLGSYGFLSPFQPIGCAHSASISGRRQDCADVCKCPVFSYDVVGFCKLLRQFPPENFPPCPLLPVPTAERVPFQTPALAADECRYNDAGLGSAVEFELGQRGAGSAFSP